MIFRSNQLMLPLLMLALCSPLANAQGCHLTPGWEAMNKGEITLNQNGENISLVVRIADRSRQRAAGYQWICEQDAANTAILFVFSKTIHSTFHMRNVFVPLDIYFFDAAGNQVDAMVMRPEPPGQDITPRYYQPDGAFRYALEIARPQTHQLDSAPAPMHLLPDSL
jgi:uncharacterized membrane protein (UPF0127 family)